MSMTALVLISQTESNKVILQYANGTVVHSNYNLLFTKKKLSKQQKDMYESQMYRQVKEARVERLHGVWFQLYDISETAKLQRWSKKTSGCWEFGQEGGQQNR